MLTLVQQVRLEVGDTDPAFPFLADDSYDYYLTKHNNNIGLASIDAAKAILMQLSINSGSETVDIFQLKNTSPESYRQALLLFIQNPSLNPLSRDVKGYVGGVSKSDIAANNSDPDNKLIVPPNRDRWCFPTSDDPFSIKVF